MGLFDYLRGQGILMDPMANQSPVPAQRPQPQENRSYLPPDTEYAMALADQQAAEPAMAPAPAPAQQGILSQLGFKTDNLGNRFANALIAAGSQNPLEAITKLQAGDQAELERVRKAKLEEQQLRQNARKLSLEELKANKPTIQASGVPGYALAIYPDGRVESIVNNEAVTAYQQQQDRVDARTDARTQAQLDMLDRRLTANADLLDRRLAANAAKGNKLNPSLQKEEDADFAALDGANGVVRDTQPLIDNLTTGKLELGAARNAWNASRNFFGKSTPESQAYAELQRSITRITNESLRLNKGVQTEGDAQRAAKEVTAAFANNDTALMAKSLQELQNINRRAVENKARAIDRRREAQGVEPMFGRQPASSQPAPAAPAQNDPLGIRQ